MKREQETPAYEAVDACYASFDWLNEKADHEYSAQTLQRVRRIVEAWYQNLVGRRIASMNPASGLYDEFKWEIEESPTPALSVEHVQKLIQAATTTRDQLLVVALAGWGLQQPKSLRFMYLSSIATFPKTMSRSLRSRIERTGPAKYRYCMGWTFSMTESTSWRPTNRGPGISSHPHRDRNHTSHEIRSGIGSKPSQRKPTFPIKSKVNDRVHSSAVASGTIPTRRSSRVSKR